jgi:hypothetical protein
MVQYGAMEFSDPKELLEALPPQKRIDFLQNS